MTDSPRALRTCLVCDLVWSLSLIAGCTYVVFWKDASGWWYLLAVLLASAWNCKGYGSPAQIAADASEED